MSRTFSTEVQNTNAIVRTYRDKPVALVARTRIGDALELEFEEGGNPLFFPADDVYRFDDGLLAALQDAFQRDDRQLLIHLWEKADHFDAF